MKVRLVLTLLWYRPPSFSYVNDVVVVMLISKSLHKKRRKGSIKTRSIPASLSFIGQVTKHTTVKWTILKKIVEGWMQKIGLLELNLPLTHWLLNHPNWRVNSSGVRQSEIYEEVLASRSQWLNQSLGITSHPEKLISLVIGDCSNPWVTFKIKTN